MRGFGVQTLSKKVEVVVGILSQLRLLKVTLRATDLLLMAGMQYHQRNMTSQPTQKHLQDAVEIGVKLHPIAMVIDLVIEIGVNLALIAMVIGLVIEIGVNLALIAMVVDLVMEMGANLPLIAVVTEVVEDILQLELCPAHSGRWRLSQSARRLTTL
jgi:hypothetical protein